VRAGVDLGEAGWSQENYYKTARSHWPAAGSSTAELYLWAGWLLEGWYAGWQS